MSTLCFLFLYAVVLGARAIPIPVSTLAVGKPLVTTFYLDIQGHRGGRGHTIENTLPGFAWGLINGVTTLEMDNGITKDGHVVVWHDESITGTKCKDTGPPTPKDPLYPYVGKYIVNLTLAQLKTLDCGSERQVGFEEQIIYPGTRISTLVEIFEFLECADPLHQMHLNIESKINARYPNRTLDVDDFVDKQHAIFISTPYYHAITFQSFDWRTLIAMRTKDKSMVLSALVSDTTVFGPNRTTSPWLAGLNPDDFPGSTLGENLAQAASTIPAQIISPSAGTSASTSADPTLPGFYEFTTKEMVMEAHRLGMQVLPWTTNSINLVNRLVHDYKVDGIITDYPYDMVRWAKFEAKLRVAPRYPSNRVLECLAKHNQVDSTSYLRNHKESSQDPICDDKRSYHSCQAPIT